MRTRRWCSVGVVCAFLVTGPLGCGDSSDPVGAGESHHAPAHGAVPFAADETVVAAVDAPEPGQARVAPTARPPAPTAAEFEAFMRGLFQLARAKDAGGLKRAASQMLLPEDTRWFHETFGGDAGASLHKDYAAGRPPAGEFARLLVELAAVGQDEIIASRYSASTDPGATGAQARALAAMKRATPLYSVRFLRPGETHGIHLWSFIRLNDAWRFVGKMKSL